MSDPTHTKTDVAAAAAKLTLTQRSFLVSPFFNSPRGVPALPAGTSFRPSRALDQHCLAERVNNRHGTNWFYLTALGRAVRAFLLKADGGK